MLIGNVSVRLMFLNRVCKEEIVVPGRFNGADCVFLSRLKTGLFGFATTLAKYDCDNRCLLIKRGGSEDSI